MSNSYITIVPINLARNQVSEISQKAVDWLTRKEIISEDLSDCVLGQNMGYPPGPRFKDIIEGDDFGLLEIGMNGLEVITERQVFDNGGNGLDEINCPKCGANNIDSDWGKTLGAWHSGSNGKLKCNQCSKESAITNYVFKPSWGFGEFGLTFWNWPRLTTKFLDEIKTFIGKDVKVIYGRR